MRRGHYHASLHLHTTMKGDMFTQSRLVPTSGYNTRAELEIKRSRFITTLQRCDSQAEARDFIETIRTEFPDARHHCSAFAIAHLDSRPTLHSSDDGEPSGTAGRPMLDMLTGIGVFNIAAVVTRYFGGTLLGTGGLVRAYADSIKQAMEGMPLVQRALLPSWELFLPHAYAGRYLAEFANAGWAYTVEYESKGVRVILSTMEDVAPRIARLSSGALNVIPAPGRIVEQSWGIITGGKPAEVGETRI